MNQIKYLLDEHVDPVLRRSLERRNSEVVVWEIGDPGAPPLGTLDLDILLWCEANGFTLITNNRKSMPVHLREHLDAGRQVPGIFVLNPRMSFGETTRELELIWGASEPEEYYNLIHFLPVSY